MIGPGWTFEQMCCYYHFQVSSIFDIRYSYKHNSANPINEGLDFFPKRKT